MYQPLFMLLRHPILDPGSESHEQMLKQIQHGESKQIIAKADS